MVIEKWLDAWSRKQEHFWREQYPKIESFIVKMRFGIYASIYLICSILIARSFLEQGRKITDWEYLVVIAFLLFIFGPFILFDEIRAWRKNKQTR